MGVGDKALAGGFVSLAASAVGMVPIHQRIVEAHAQPLCAGGVDEFANQISSRPLSRSAVVGELGVEVAETLVMLGGHHHVFLSGTPRQFGPLASGVGAGLKMFCQQLVLRKRNTFHFEGPFMLAHYAVQSPMDENAELGFRPPCHSLRPRGRGLAL